MALLSWWGNWGILVMNKPFYFSIFSHLNVLPDIFICIMTWFYRTVMRSKVKSIEPLEGKELWRKNSRRWEGGAAASRPLQASALLPALLLWPHKYSGQCLYSTITEVSLNIYITYIHFFLRIPIFFELRTSRYTFLRYLFLLPHPKSSFHFFFFFFFTLFQLTEARLEYD